MKLSKPNLPMQREKNMSKAHKNPFENYTVFETKYTEINLKTISSIRNGNTTKVNAPLGIL